jgi:carbon storage regulator
VLVLSRRPGTAILIGHDVKVTIEMVADDDVCLTVDCPPNVTVERKEEVDIAKKLEGRGRHWDPTRMKVLSRQARPALLINSEVLIAVQSISNDSVRIGISAPGSVGIYREEVYQQMLEANRSAAAEPDDYLAGLAGLLPPPPDPESPQN